MKLLYNALSGAKLWLCFGLVVAFLAVVLVTAYVGMAGINEGYQVALALAAFERNNNDQRAAVLTMLSTSEQTDREAARQIIANAAKRNDALFLLLHKLLEDDWRSLSRIEELNGIRAAHKQTRDQMVIPLIQSGNLEQAKTLSLGVQQEAYMRMRNLASALSEEATEHADKLARQAIAILLFELLFAFIISFVIFRVLSLLDKTF